MDFLHFYLPAEHRVEAIKNSIKRHAPEWFIAILFMLNSRFRVIILPQKGGWVARMKDTKIPLFSLKNPLLTHILYCKSSYERYFSINPGYIVVDAGACIGGFTLFASKRVGRMDL